MSRMWEEGASVPPRNQAVLRGYEKEEAPVIRRGFFIVLLHVTDFGTLGGL